MFVKPIDTVRAFALITIALGITPLITILITIGSTVSTVAADPIGDILNPPRTAEAITATPLDDPWVVPPPGYESSPPGTILHTRTVTVGPLITPVTTTQLLVRSTDAKSKPTAIVTSVIVPTAPWTGPGPRPVVSYNMAINSLGATCQPSWTMQRGIAFEIVAVQLFLSKNYAVVVTDHEGPRHAYAAARMAAHAVLDGLRGAVTTPLSGLDPSSPIAMNGYSGGAIATGWAVQQAPEYAPELNIVGAAFGGPPTDFDILRTSLNGTEGSTVYLSAAMGVAREYPEMLTLFNDNAWRLAAAVKDLCFLAVAPGGLVARIRLESLTDDPGAFDGPTGRAVTNDNRLGDGGTPTAPVFIYQGRQEFWIPKQGAEAVYDKWCARGATVRLEEYLGEHVIVAGTGLPGATSWIDDRLAGVPAAPGCSAFGR